MGIQLRVEALKKAVRDEKRKTDIEQAAQRLIDKTGMGAQYQFMGITGTKHLQQTEEQKWPFV
jgi:NADH dehydrogenase [ubiquinone] 1 alpha subcomplex assembly factor 7